HHPWWNSHASSLRADNLVDWCNTHDLELLNTPDIPTFFRKRHDSFIKSTINLTFVSKAIQDMNPSWYISEEEESGSDHEILQFSIELDSSNLVENLLYKDQYNLKKVNWPEVIEKAKKLLKNLNFN